jgi:hypothetical protein
LKQPAEYNFDGALIGKFHSRGNRDELGRIITDEPGWVDGGDTCQRVGMYYFGLQIFEDLFGDEELFNLIMDNELPKGSDEDYIEALNRLESKDNPGVYKRHDDEDFWYSSDGVMSRDQCMPLVLSMAARKASGHLYRFFHAHLGRGLLFTTNVRKNGSTPSNHGQQFNPAAKPLTEFHKNVIEYNIPLVSLPDGYRNFNWKLPDITGPSFWATYIRAFDLWFLYPLLLILDLEFLGNSLIAASNPQDNDVLKHVMTATYFDQKYKTPWVWLANKYVNKSKDMIRRLTNYFDAPGEPWFMTGIYAPILKKILG